MESTVLTSAFLIGVAAGGRSMTGLATIAWTTPPGTPPRALDLAATPRARAALTIAAAGDLVADKLPQTPSRLSPQGLTSRLATGALGGAALALRSGGANPGLGALSGAAGSVAGSYLGAAWRRWAGTEKVSAFVAAVAEDLVTVATAVIAAGL